MNRRGFLKQTALGATTPSAVSLAQPRPAGPNERIGVGLIGCGGMGKVDLGDFQRNPDVEVVALCDVFEPNLAAALAMTGGKARSTGLSPAPG